MPPRADWRGALPEERALLPDEPEAPARREVALREPEETDFRL